MLRFSAKIRPGAILAVCALLAATCTTHQTVGTFAGVQISRNQENLAGSYSEEGIAGRHCDDTEMGLAWPSITKAAQTAISSRDRGDGIREIRSIVLMREYRIVYIIPLPPFFPAKTKQCYVLVQENDEER